MILNANPGEVTEAQKISYHYQVSVELPKLGYYM